VIDLLDITKKYSIVLADPPWGYKDRRIGYGGVAGHYETMTLDQIKALPVKEIVNDDAFLFLWATFPNLDKALELFPFWGYKYKTIGFSWIKTNKIKGTPFFGIGSYTRSNCEVCLIGTRGKPKIASRSVSSVVISPKMGHSQKPPEVRDKIVELCGDIPRIELFAREMADGWSCWGDGVEGRI
jgi:N6-adenosine-specific RNA methylase IME4